MNPFSIVVLAALFAASAGVAGAETLNLASYGSTATAPAGVANAATFYQGGLVYGFIPVTGGPSYSIGTNGVWAAPVGNSSWVSQDPQNYPGGVNVEPTGVYFYTSTFSLSTPAEASGTITVLADDTTGVFLNGTQVTAAAGFATSGTCDSGRPNCTVPTTYSLTGFVAGTNTLGFNVLQEHGSAEGVDFAGIVNVTPEPTSLLLLGTGLSMMAGFARYRRVQA